MSLQWLEWAQKLQAIAQTGLYYENHPFDVERYEQVQQIAAEMMAAYTNAEPTLVLDMFKQEWGHATPKVDVRGVAFQDGKILLVKERSDGHWTLPGGWADIGEPPSQAVQREVFEESGFETKATKVLAVYERDHPRHGHPPEPHYTFKLFFRSRSSPFVPTPISGVARPPPNGSYGGWCPTRLPGFLSICKIQTGRRILISIRGPNAKACSGRLVHLHKEPYLLGEL